MIKKDNEAYKTIGEVAEIVNLINPKNGSLSTHTLRFWEKEFKQIKPKILAGNRRYYDNDTIEIIKKVKFLLKEKGMTIQGVKKYLAEGQSELDENSKLTINTTNYYVKKPAGGEKAKVKLKAKKYNPATRKHEVFVEKKLPPHSK